MNKKMIWTAGALALLLAAGGPALAAEQAQAAIEDPAAVQQKQDDSAREYFTDLEVVDQNGNKLRFFTDVLKDKVVLINVIFTNCQDACPMITNHLVRTREQIAPAIRDDVWFVSISTDPVRDTPEAMKAFAVKQGADQERWLWLTGTEENMTLILRKLQRYNPNINAHSTQLLAGTTRERHEWIPLPAGVQPDAIATALRSLVEDRPG